MKYSLKEDGLCLVKGFFTKSEIADLRRCLDAQISIDQTQNKIGFYKAGGIYGIGDLMSKEYLQFIVDKLKSKANELLEGQAVYFGDSTYTKGIGQRGFHRDNVDRNFKVGEDWQSSYDLIRFGIYLQDHSAHSGGLEVIKGTHNNLKGDVIIVDSEVGDLVVWNMRLLHSGNAVRFRYNPRFSVTKLKGYEYLIPKCLTYPEEKERGALFISFGKKGNHLNRYINYHLLGRQDMRSHLYASGFNPEALSIDNLLNKYQ